MSSPNYNPPRVTSSPYDPVTNPRTSARSTSGIPLIGLKDGDIDDSSTPTPERQTPRTVVMPQTTSSPLVAPPRARRPAAAGPSNLRNLNVNELTAVGSSKTVALASTKTVREKEMAALHAARVEANEAKMSRRERAVAAKAAADADAAEGILPMAVDVKEKGKEREVEVEVAPVEVAPREVPIEGREEVSLGKRKESADDESVASDDDSDSAAPLKLAPPQPAPSVDATSHRRILRPRPISRGAAGPSRNKTSERAEEKAKEVDVDDNAGSKEEDPIQIVGGPVTDDEICGELPVSEAAETPEQAEGAPGEAAVQPAPTLPALPSPSPSPTLAQAPAPSPAVVQEAAEAAAAQPAPVVPLPETAVTPVAEITEDWLAIDDMEVRPPLPRSMDRWPADQVGTAKTAPAPVEQHDDEDDDEDAEMGGVVELEVEETSEDVIMEGDGVQDSWAVTVLVEDEPMGGTSETTPMDCGPEAVVAEDATMADEEEPQPTSVVTCEMADAAIEPEEKPPTEGEVQQQVEAVSECLGADPVLTDLFSVLVGLRFQGSPAVEVLNRLGLPVVEGRHGLVPDFRRRDQLARGEYGGALWVAPDNETFDGMIRYFGENPAVMDQLVWRMARNGGISATGKISSFVSGPGDFVALLERAGWLTYERWTASADYREMAARKRLDPGPQQQQLLREVCEGSPLFYRACMAEASCGSRPPVDPASYRLLPPLTEEKSIELAELLHPSTVIWPRLSASYRTAARAAVPLRLASAQTALRSERQSIARPSGPPSPHLDRSAHSPLAPGKVAKRSYPSLSQLRSLVLSRKTEPEPSSFRPRPSSPPSTESSPRRHQPSASLQTPVTPDVTDTPQSPPPHVSKPASSRPESGDKPVSKLRLAPPPPETPEESEGGSMQVRCVPESELAVGPDGKKLPFANVTAADLRKQQSEEIGSFGKGRRGRSLPRSKTPGHGKKEDASIPFFATCAQNTFGDKQRRGSRTRTSPPRFRMYPASTEADRVPTEVVLRGFQEGQNWAAIDLFERIGGRICEDYARYAPTDDPTIVGTGSVYEDQRLTPAEIKKAFTLVVGPDWIKVTFESAEAAARAIRASPMKVKGGHMVTASLYQGAAPRAPTGPADGSDLAPPSADDADEAAAAAALTERPGPRRIITNRAVAEGVYKRPPPVMILPLPHPPSGKYVLRPASEALLPVPTMWEKIQAWFDATFGSWDELTREVPRLDDGEFDYVGANWYWKTYYWIERVFGGVALAKDD